MSQIIIEDAIQVSSITLKEYMQCVREEAYRDNPELAQQLYYYSKNIITHALQGKNSKDMTTTQFAAQVYAYWMNRQGLEEPDILWLLKVGTSEATRKRLRLEWDEEYVELYWDGEL